MSFTSPRGSVPAVRSKHRVLLTVLTARPRNARYALGVILVLAACAFGFLVFGRNSSPAQAQGQAQFANPAFKALWDRTDGLVATGAIKRPWIWGPVPGKTLAEPYNGLPGNAHQVQYFDKGRMEINNPNGNPNDPFYVTNGLLAVELISGQMQTGVNSYEQRAPAAIDLASDADDPTAPTYQSFNGVSNIPGAPNQRRKTSQVGQIVRTAIDRQGVTQPWPKDHPDYGVHLAYFEPTTGHNIPDVFWTYLNEQTDILQNGKVVKGPLFSPWFAVTGYPISEPYWSYVKVAGKYTDVLIQAYERRVLTFVPHLPSPFKVQMGNIGQHYYEWRYLTQSRPTPRPGLPTPTIGAPLASVTVDGISYRRSITDINGTYATITNRGQTPVTLNGWRLDSPKWGYNDRFFFPNGITMAPGASLRVHSGPGINGNGDIYMFRSAVMWDGQLYDLAVLYDNYGREVSRFFPAAEVGKPPTPPPSAPTPTVGRIPTGGATATVPPLPTTGKTTSTPGTPVPTATGAVVPPSPVGTGAPTTAATTATAQATARTATATATAGAQGQCPAVDPSKKSTISATGDVDIYDVEPQGQEYVDVENLGDSAADVSGWVVRDKNNTSVRYVFPSGSTIDSFDDALIYTEPGHQYTFNSQTPIWDDCGAALELLDNHGQVVATFAYGTYLIESP